MATLNAELAGAEVKVEEQGVKVETAGGTKVVEQAAKVEVKVETRSATIVTGGTRGIGRAVALKMSKLGPVLLTGRTEASAKAVCEEITASGGSAAYCVGDVSDPELARLVSRKLLELDWTPANLVLNAGISMSGSTVSIKRADWSKMFAVNVESNLFFVQEIVPSMLTAKSGNIVFLAGMAGVKAYRGMSAYCASKFAVVGFARALSEEVSSKGIRCVPICPAPVDTDMTGVIVNSLVQRGSSKDDAVAKIAAGSGQKRLLTADEVADKVAWVCSAEFTGKSGEPLIVNVEDASAK